MSSDSRARNRVRLRARCQLQIETRRSTPIVLMLRARLGPQQRVLDQTISVDPKVPLDSFDDAFGNLGDRFAVPAGEHQIVSEVLAEVASEVDVHSEVGRTPAAKLSASTQQFVMPSRYCPSDKLTALAKDVTAGTLAGYGEVAAISAFVHRRLSYRYGVSDSSTDALHTLQAGAGVCRDFTHVAIALCRSLDIPARMVAGYLYDRSPVDLHAWFEAHVGGRWYTFDPTEDALLGGRIVLAYGRDAADVAFMTNVGELTLRSMNVSIVRTLEEGAAMDELRATA